MANQSLGKRFFAAILALVILIGACPLQAFASETDTVAREDQDTRLPFTEVEDLDANNLHDAAKADHPEEEPPYEDTDVVRVSIVLNKKANILCHLSLNYEKIVIAMECDLPQDQDGIKIVGAVDFLLSE